MAFCKVQYGISYPCGDLIFPGGAYPDFYVGYVSDLSTKFSLTQAAVISTLTFTAYNGLVKFSSAKFANNFTYAGGKGAGGNIFITHRASLKLISLSIQDDVEVQRLMQSQDAFIIAANNNEQWFVYGPSNGLSYVAGEIGGTGVGQGDDISDTIVLEGAEKVKPLRFLVTDFQGTINYLNGKVI